MEKLIFIIFFELKHDNGHTSIFIRREYRNFEKSSITLHNLEKSIVSGGIELSDGLDRSPARRASLEEGKEHYM